MFRALVVRRNALDFLSVLTPTFAAPDVCMCWGLINQPLIHSPSIFEFPIARGCNDSVYLEYHSLDQVVVGAVVGTSVGAAWHILTERVRGRQIANCRQPPTGDLRGASFDLIRWLDVPTARM